MGKVENEGMPVVRLDRQLKYQGNILKIYEDTVLANGHEAHWDYIHHDGAAAVLPVTSEGKILMVRQYRNALNRYTLEIPAGKLDHGPDEDPAECAKRELSEETGYDAEHWQQLISIATTPGFSDEIIHLYKAWGLQKFAQHTDEDEFIGVQAFTPAELRRMVADGELYDAKTLCALYAAKVI